jgi:hypothetical protein
MHSLHGAKLTFVGDKSSLTSWTGYNPDLDGIPEIMLDNAECIPVEINGKYFWLVSDVDNCTAYTANPNDPGDGTLEGVEVEVSTDVPTMNELFKFKNQSKESDNRHAVAFEIANIAGETIDIEDYLAIADSLLEDNIDFDLILSRCQNSTQDEFGYTSEAIKDAVLSVYTPSGCQILVEKTIESSAKERQCIKEIKAAPSTT